MAIATGLSTETETMESPNLHIVLMATSHPGNIGAAARAMKTMGLSSLRLVRPKLYPCAEASARASGASDVLAAAGGFDRPDQAVADCGLVLGASARLRSIPWPVVDAREGAGMAAQACADTPVALVFGRERSGLTNDEMERCHTLVNIPANPEYSSLNLAASVQVMSYELRMALMAASAVPTLPAAPDLPVAATGEEMDGLYAHMEQALLEIGFLNPAAPRQSLRRLRRLFNRAQLEQAEVHMVRGIFTAAQRARRNQGGG